MVWLMGGGCVFGQVVDIPDPNLATTVRVALELPVDAPISQQEMLRPTHLTANESKITNLTGLEHATNLRQLTLARNNISNLKPLAELTKLNHLGLWVNPISDLSPIANLINLRGLHLAGCHISDLTPLANLTQLEWLTLEWQRENKITDIKPLANLTKLRHLRLHGNRIVDISPLANLVNLEMLRLDSNQIVDINPLANLIRLKELRVENNPIIDYSPLDGLSLTDLTRDEVCKLPGLPIRERIESRNLPSIAQPWGSVTINRSTFPRTDQFAYHDIFWSQGIFGLQLRETPQGYGLEGNIESGLVRRDEYLAKNPNMIFLFEVRVRDARINSQYPEDWPYWLRDQAGNIVKNVDSHTLGLIDFRIPEVQDIIVQQAIAISKCGLYDGIFIDWWNEGRVTLASPDWSVHYTTAAEELEIKISLLKRIRAQVPDNFLILANNNRLKVPFSAPYMNGSFMETFRDNVGGHREYTREGIIEIEDAFIWLEANMREPQLNCLEGWGIPTEPPDSPDNRRWMRLFTTMSLTLSDGYVLYNVGWDRTKSFPGHDHYWYPFWDADLGRPISTTTQQYQGVEGLYIREFTSGWAVYNRSGQTQQVRLPQSVTGASSGLIGTAHQLGDLDGEIYLKTKDRTDRNGDGVVNVLDLILVAQAFGTPTHDMNGDGTTNILDLIRVASQLSNSNN